MDKIPCLFMHDNIILIALLMFTNRFMINYYKSNISLILLIEKHEKMGKQF